MSHARPVKFHDLAFFDPVIYESLRQLVVDAEKPGSDNATALQVQKIPSLTKILAKRSGHFFSQKCLKIVLVKNVTDLGGTPQRLQQTQIV